MRAIVKGNEPANLTTYRAQNNPASETDFNDYPEKAELRACLVREQKSICCYCMGRIVNDPLKMKIEHWRCNELYQEVRLTYSNLLGACLGGTGQPPNHQHCDTRKANKNLQWNPADAAHMIEARLSYLVDGTIESTDATFNDQLNSVLGLNLPILKNNRKAVLDTVLQWWRSTPDARQKVQQQIEHRTNQVVEHQPYSPVALWLLRQKLKGAAA